ncbi:MAG: hypothetical protein AABX37_00680, partial [Nanoarchaeota archaeon]
ISKIKEAEKVNEEKEKSDGLGVREGMQERIEERQEENRERYEEYQEMMKQEQEDTEQRDGEGNT